MAARLIVIGPAGAVLFNFFFGSAFRDGPPPRARVCMYICVYLRGCRGIGVGGGQL